jgi:GLPGLI family protein
LRHQLSTMKKLFILGFILQSFLSNAQEIKGTFFYQGKFNGSFGRSENHRPYWGKLIIDGNRSLFTMKEEGQHHASLQDNTIDLRSDSLFTVYKDHESNSLLFEFTDLNQRPHYFADTLFPMEWITTEEHKMIGGIPCLKAVTRFKGRGYTAWYAPTITINDGPWKLGGLPGLILEAYDDEDNWRMEFISRTDENDFDASYYESKIEKGIEGFPAFVGFVKKLFSRLEASFNNNSDCVGCQNKSMIKFHSWEHID